jgi:hypothetical protein
MNLRVQELELENKTQIATTRSFETLSSRPGACKQTQKHQTRSSKNLCSKVGAWKQNPDSTKQGALEA